ncbi:MAG: SDR family oxidoreductase [Pirellulaceae bacterium]
MPHPLSEQVVVITGASSGIGRDTAIELAKRGTRLVLAARDDQALGRVAEEVERLGGRVLTVVTDVGEWDQVERLAQEAVTHFGRIDTWINNAAVSTYGTFEQTTIEEIDRVLRVDLLGPIYGTKAALPHMKRQNSGTIITVGSVLGERSLPLLSTYCTAKHGLRGFIESLRLELEREQSNIALTLVLPASINTPFYRHARSKQGVMPRPFPPVYDPHIVTEAIVHAAQYPQRDIHVGGAARLLAALQRISPALVDWYLLQGDRAFRNMLTDRPDDGRDNLFAPMGDTGATRGEFGREAKRRSLYTHYVELKSGGPLLLLAAMVGAGAALLWRQRALRRGTPAAGWQSGLVSGERRASAR